MAHTTNFEENKTLFILCDCKSEVLTIEYDEEIKMAELAIFQHSASCIRKMTWYQKLRYIWQVLKHNKPFTDQIMINRKQIRELKQFLSEIA